TIVVTLGKAILDRHCLALDEASFFQPLAKCGYEGRALGGRAAVKESYHRHRRLRPHRERPRCRRTAECGQQFPPSDGDCHAPLPCEVHRGKDTTPPACCP